MFTDGTDQEVYELLRAAIQIDQNIIVTAVPATWKQYLGKLNQI